MMKSSLLTLTVLIAASTASPTRLQSRAIDSGLLAQLELGSQYAAASYCNGNHDGPGSKLTCPTGNCPRVESADTTTTVEFRDTMVTDTTGYVAVDKTHRSIIAAFRGTKSARAWINNFRFFPVSTDICANCKLHDGFNRAVGEVRSRVVPAVKAALTANPGFTVVVTGHSLGGAVATITAAELRKAGTGATLYTYGAPRVGNRAFAEFVQAQAGGNYRVTNANDLVPRLPPMEFGYVHVNPEYHIVSVGDNDVDESEVTVYQNPTRSEGNSGASGFSTDAHGWYFGEIGACGGPLEIA